MYVKYGSEDSFRGLLIDEVNNLDLEDAQGYEIISEEEYESLRRRMNDPKSYFTSTGALLSEKGKKLYDEITSILEELRNKEENRLLSFFVTKFKKEMELGIINRNDLSLEMEYTKVPDNLKEEIVFQIDKEIPHSPANLSEAERRYKEFMEKNA